MSLTVLGMVLNRKCPYHCKASPLCPPLGIEGTLWCIILLLAVFSGVWYLLTGSTEVLGLRGKMPPLICLTTDVVWTMYSCLASVTNNK